MRHTNTVFFRYVIVNNMLKGVRYYYYYYYYFEGGKIFLRFMILPHFFFNFVILCRSIHIADNMYSFLIVA